MSSAHDESVNESGRSNVLEFAGIFNYLKTQPTLKVLLVNLIVIFREVNKAMLVKKQFIENCYNNNNSTI